MSYQFLLFSAMLIQLQYVVVAQIGFLDSNPPQLLRTISPANRMQEPQRASLCSGSKAHPNDRYHNATGVCYRIHTTGPCTNGMIFQDDGDVYGECDCDTIRNDRTLIFHPETNRCYPIFSQGYCPPKQWLLLTEDFEPYCRANPCHGRNIGNKNAELVPFRGTCAELDAPSRYCPQGEVLTFIKDEIEPNCGKPKDPSIVPFALTGARFRCAPGSARSITGKCKPVKKFTL